jgi:hypothetical protein
MREKAGSRESLHIPCSDKYAREDVKGEKGERGKKRKDSKKKRN